MYVCMCFKLGAVVLGTTYFRGQREAVNTAESEFNLRSTTRNQVSVGAVAAPFLCLQSFFCAHNEAHTSCNVVFAAVLSVLRGRSWRKSPTSR